MHFAPLPQERQDSPSGDDGAAENVTKPPAESPPPPPPTPAAPAATVTEQATPPGNGPPPEAAAAPTASMEEQRRESDTSVLRKASRSTCPYFPFSPFRLLFLFFFSCPAASVSPNHAPPAVLFGGAAARARSPSSSSPPCFCWPLSVAALKTFSPPRAKFSQPKGRPRRRDAWSVLRGRAFIAATPLPGRRGPPL